MTHALASDAGPAQAETRSCPLCGGPLTAGLGRVTDAITGESFGVLRCSGCELGVTLPAPADLGPYYAHRYYGGRHGFTAAYCLRRRLRFVARTTSGPGSLADIGCGDGSFLLAARRAGWRVAGTEVSPLDPSLGLEVRGSIAELRPLGPFECITLWHSLEHLGNPGGALADLAAMLAPGGSLLVAVPNSRGWQARLFGRHWLHLDVPRHLYHFGGASLRGALAHAGLRPTRIWHQELEYDLFGWIQSALNAAMPRQNILFDALTGRAARVGHVGVAANMLLAGLLLGPAAAATAASTLAGQGGTLVVAARART